MGRVSSGIVPSREAFEVYPELRACPDLVVNMPHTRLACARWARRPAIAIYTRGLHGSNGFKLAEYLASSKCIIGERPAHTLPDPLGASHQVCESIDSILAACDRMLTNTRELERIRFLSWEYYRRNIRYDARIRTLFEPLPAERSVRAGPAQ